MLAALCITPVYAFILFYSMLKESEFSDVTLKCGVDRFPAHLPLIHARLPDLYAVIDGPQNGTEEPQEFDMAKLGISPEHAKDLVQYVSKFFI